MSKMQRRKGASGEREVVSLSRKVGLEARRTWETAQSRINPECDVVISDRNFPFQVKRRKNFKFLYDSLKGVHGTFLRGDNQSWLALLPAEEFLKLLKFYLDRYRDCGGTN